MAKNLAAILTSLAVIVPAPAFACSVVVTHPPSYRERMVEARATVARASAIVDGEVIEPARRDARTGLVVPANVKVHRVLKGQVGDIVRVGEETSCDIFFDKAGERSRFVLFDGPDVYRTWVDYSNARAIDRVLKSDRRKDWPLSPR